MLSLLQKIVIGLLVFLPACFGGNPAGPDAVSGEKEVVFLLHGLGRSRSAMWVLASRLKDAGFLVENIGYSSIHNSPEEILADISSQIDSRMPDKSHMVHFVGHSLGGLLIRAYLDRTEVENLGRVVLIGSPSRGTPVVDKYHDAFWMKMMGDMTLALGTGAESFPRGIAAPYYPVGVIAGIKDGKHNENILPGKDDGLVPLESTKLEGMTDFIVVESSHWRLRYNREVADQTIAFLKHGRFKEEN